MSKEAEQARRAEGTGVRLLAFVGGAQGAGKTAVLTEVKRDKGYAYVNVASMGRLLAETAMRMYGKTNEELDRNKEQMQELQMQTIEKLRKLPYLATLLDGHYVRIYDDGTVIGHYNIGRSNNVSFDAHVVIVGEPEEILKRRISDGREDRHLSLELVRKEQDAELNEARRIAGENCAGFYVVANRNVEKAAESVKRIVDSLLSQRRLT